MDRQRLTKEEADELLGSEPGILLEDNHSWTICYKVGSDGNIWTKFREEAGWASTQHKTLSDNKLIFDDLRFCVIKDGPQTP